MPAATIVSAWRDDTNAYLVVRVTGEGSAGGAVEYSGSTPLRDDEGQAKPNATLKAELVASCKAQRDAQRAERPALPIGGTVTI